MTSPADASPFPDSGRPQTEAVDQTVQRVVADYLRRRAAGENPAVEDYVKRYPELEAVLRKACRIAEARQKAQSPETEEDPPHIRSTVSLTVSAAKAGRAPIDTDPALTEQAAQEPSLPREFGRYRILKQLGRGGMGAVYLAEDTHLKRQVALKVPKLTTAEKKELLERFQREAQMAASLRHPNICPVFDIGEMEGVLYITMAYLEGRPLSAVISPDRPLSLFRCALIVRKLAVALQEAHTAGIIHRDLKPSNIMIDAKGEPIVLDFGLARTTAPDDARLTESGMVIGSPAYMSPEQVHSDPQIGPATDIYSLGVILYELMTARLPFEGAAMAIFGQIVSNDPPAPSSWGRKLDPELETICLKMMAKRPEDRYASMNEVAVALTEFLKRQPRKGDQTLATRALSPPRQTPVSQPERKKPQKARRTKWMWGGAAAVVLLGVIVIIVRSGNQETEIRVSDEESAQVVVENGTTRVTTNSGSPGPRNGPKDAGNSPSPNLSDEDYAWIPPNQWQPVATANRNNILRDAKGKPRYGLRYPSVAAHGVFPNVIDDFEKPFTVEAWVEVQPAELTRAWSAIFSVRENGPQLMHWAGKEISGRWGFEWEGVGACYGNSNHTRGERVHVAGVWDGKEPILYLNGQRMPHITTVGNFEEEQRIKQRSLNFKPERCWLGCMAGVIDEFRISRGMRYQVSFTPQEQFDTDNETLLLYHFDEGQGPTLTDSSGKAHHGLVGGAEWVVAVKPQADRNVPSPQATSDHWLPVKPAKPDQIPSDAQDQPNYGLRYNMQRRDKLPPFLKQIEGPVTIEAWVEIEPEILYTEWADVFTHDRPEDGYALKIFHARWQLRRRTSEKTYYGYWPSTGVTNRLFHVAGVWDGKEARLFVDGVPMPDYKSGGPMPVPSDVIQLGPFPGVLDELRVSRGARYTKKFTPKRRFEPDGETLALYHFDEGKGDVITDSSGNGHHGTIVGGEWVVEVKPEFASAVNESSVQSGESGPVDLLKLVEPTQHSLLGTWRIENGKLVSPKRQYSKLVIPYQLPDAYDMILTAARTSGDEHLILGLASHGYPFFVVFDVYRGDSVRLGKIAPEVSPTPGGHIGQKGRTFPTNTDAVTLHIEVRSNQIRIRDGNRTVIEWNGNPKHLSTETQWDAPNPRMPVLGTYGPTTEFTISQLKITPIDSKTVIPTLPTPMPSGRWQFVETKNAPAPSAGEKPNFGLRFQNASDIVRVPALYEKDEPFTLECWVELRNTSQRHVIVNHWGPHGFWLTYMGDQKPGWDFGELTGSKGAHIYTTAPNDVNRMVHLAGTWDGKSLELFVDGKRQKGEKGNCNTGRIQPAAFLMGTTLDGVLDELRVSRGVRYKADFQPKRRFESDKDTLALYHFDEGQGEEVKDSSGHDHHGKLSGAVWMREVPAKSNNIAVKPAAKSVCDILEEPSRIQVLGTPLKDALQFLSARHKVRIEFAANVTAFEKRPITFFKANAALKDVLKEMLSPLRLTHVAKEDHILIRFANANSGKQ